MYYNSPYYPYPISIYSEEMKKPDHMEQMKEMMEKHMQMTEKIYRRVVSIDQSCHRMEKMMEEIMRQDP